MAHRAGARAPLICVVLSVAAHALALLLPGLVAERPATRTERALLVTAPPAAEVVRRPVPALERVEVEPPALPDDPVLVEVEVAERELPSDPPPELPATVAVAEPVDWARLRWRSRRLVGPDTGVGGAAPDAAVAAAQAEVASERTAPPTPPRFRRGKAPEYPLASRRRREEGTVVLRLVVGDDGHVAGVAVATTSGFERLDRAAADAAWSWQFDPATRGGVAVRGSVLHQVTFRLEAA
jgi:protein TonB